MLNKFMHNNMSLVAMIRYVVTDAMHVKVSL